MVVESVVAIPVLFWKKIKQKNDQKIKNERKKKAESKKNKGKNPPKIPATVMTIAQNTNHTCQGTIMPVGRSPTSRGRLSLNGFSLCSSILLMAQTQNYGNKLTRLVRVILRN